SLHTNRLLLLSGVTVGSFIYAYGVQNDMWWKGERAEFHTNWREDWNSSLGADKIGHFYFGQSVATIYKHAFRWVGFSNENSVLYSGLFAFSYQTFLEIRDGFSKDYGFSWGDFGANLLGSMYPLLQYRIDVLKNFNLKVSYWPSERFKNNSNKYILDDYESTYHWLSIDINYWLPSEAAKIFPDFINLGIGHSVKGLDNLGSANHEFYIGIDWDLEALPGESGILKFVKDIFNLYHLPAPAIKFYPNFVWYGLRF
ncbi:MAG: DUF2279 domain-containing protein, partial [Melioribacteraceae bacterium]|nr:DUF2279 domain-containing protein [Melioribacteraceae bacterium]